MFIKSDKFMDCKDEQQFKMEHLRDCVISGRNIESFCIETEETVKGFPDVLILNIGTTGLYTRASFNEYKFTENGTVKFQPAQLAFYRKHCAMLISVVAYNKKTKTLHCFNTKNLFEEDSPYYIGTGNTLNLAKAEKHE